MRLISGIMDIRNYRTGFQQETRIETPEVVQDCAANGYNTRMARIARMLVPVALILSMALGAAAHKSDPTVYVTEQGKKYHLKNCRLKHGSTGIKLSVAKQKGYKPCAVCKPPK